MNKEITTLLLTISSLYELYQNCVSARAPRVHVHHLFLPNLSLRVDRNHTHNITRKGLHSDTQLLYSSIVVFFLGLFKLI